MGGERLRSNYQEMERGRREKKPILPKGRERHREFTKELETVRLDVTGRRRRCAREIPVK